MEARTRESGKQSGVALVSVLLVVVIATVLGVSMVEEQNAAIQTTRNFLQRGQAMQYALGGEELARQILHEDFEEGLRRDHLREPWAAPDLHFDFDEGEVNLRISDLQGRLNVNGLVEGNRNHAVVRQRIQNLIVAIGGDPVLLDRLADWLDRDNNARITGAEDFEYLAFDPPYRTAGQPIVDATEIRLLGLDASIYYSLVPHVAALPDAASDFNVNTATPFAYQALAPGISIEAAESLAIRRDEEEGFESVTEFLQSPELAGLGVSEVGLGVQSSFFEVRVIARYQDRYSYLTSIVHRGAIDGELRVIQRDYSRNFTPNFTSPAPDEQTQSEQEGG